MMRFVAASFMAVALWTLSIGVRPVVAQATAKPATPAATTPATQSGEATLASQGVYTKAQAERGGNMYDTTCASCHELGRFKGADFANAWADKSLDELHSAVKSMPMDAPGSLKPQEYADILAYFLSINDYPAGETELKGDDAVIKAVKVDAKKP